MKFQSPFLQKRKYEILLLALIQHLFIGVFLTDLPFYTKVIWPINMVILGVASIGVFVDKSKWRNVLRDFLFFLVVAFPVAIPIFSEFPYFMVMLNLSYVFYFVFIFSEVMRFLIKPSYINVDVISASACGYFLLIEISTFLFQFFIYQNPSSFKGVDFSNPAGTYMDMVYFCSITLTSIGFGDITPNSYYTKLVTAFFGIVGQFYSVVLVGILISKFSSREK